MVYICFGSLARLNKEQNFEIARGIEASGHKFLWVLPKNTKDDDVKEEELLLPHGFEERMREKKRGMVVRGWVPQGLILKHEGGLLNKRVKEMKEKAHKVVQEGGNSYDNVTTLVQSLRRMMNVHG